MNPEKALSHQVELMSNHLQSELERVKRNLRRFFASVTRVPDLDGGCN